MNATSPKKFDLASLTIPELRELAAEVAARIADKEREEKAVLAAEIETLAKERGFTVSDILSLFPNAPIQSTDKPAAKSKERSTVAPKFQHPTDSTLTWSGRGRQPVWVRDHIASGHTLDSLAIRPT